MKEKEGGERSASYPRFSTIFTCVRTAVKRLSNSGFYNAGTAYMLNQEHIIGARGGSSARLHASRWMKVAPRRREEVAVDGCKLEIASPTVLSVDWIYRLLHLSARLDLSSLPGF